MRQWPMPPGRRQSRIEAPARFNKVFGQRDQGPGLDVPFRQVAPAEHKTATGNPRRPARTCKCRTPQIVAWMPGDLAAANHGFHDALPSPGGAKARKVKPPQPATGPLTVSAWSCGIAGRAEGHQRLPGDENTVLGCGEAGVPGQDHVGRRLGWKSAHAVGVNENADTDMLPQSLLERLIARHQEQAADTSSEQAIVTSAGLPLDIVSSSAAPASRGGLRAPRPRRREIVVPPR